MSDRRYVVIPIDDPEVAALAIDYFDESGGWLEEGYVPVPPDDRLAQDVDLATRDIMTYWDDDAVIKEKPGTTPRDIIEAARRLRAAFQLGEEE